MGRHTESVGLSELQHYHDISSLYYSYVYALNSFIGSNSVTIPGKQTLNVMTGRWDGRSETGPDRRGYHLEQQADVSLIAACQQGDPRAYRHVYELYKDRIYGLCRSMSGNDEDAADLTQDVFISAFKAIQSFRMEAAFGT
jgi:hypothetical protein